MSESIPQTPAAEKPLPRGIRNNNPGNVERDGTKWQGLADDQSSDDRFCVFSTPIDGIRALARILITYQDKWSLRTVRRIVYRWAPPTENNSEAYVAQVATAIGVEPDDDIDVHSYAYLEPLVQAIMRHENGDPLAFGRGARWFPQWQIDEGLHRVGVIPVKRAAKVMATPEVIGTGVAGAAGLSAAGAALMESATSLRQASDNSVLITVLVALVIVAGLGLTLYGVVRRLRQ